MHIVKVFGQLALITAGLAVLIAIGGQPRGQTFYNPLEIVAFEAGNWFSLFAISAVVAGIAAVVSKKPRTALAVGSFAAVVLATAFLIGRQI
jgi:hypothetical protein